MRLLPQSWIRAALLAIGALVASAGVAVMLFVSPTYEASVRMKVEKEISDDVQSIAANRATFDPYWVQDQFEALHSLRSRSSSAASMFTPGSSSLRSLL
jgi:hypothetical protein